MARSWAEHGLRLSPRDDYGLDLAGTASFLMDYKIEALRYWNRLNRPHLTELQVRPTGSASRQRIAEEIRLMPGDRLSAHEIEAARWRLRQHRYIRAVQFRPMPGPTPDQYSLEVDAGTRRGVGSRPEFLFNTLSNIGFRTWRVTWWDIAGSGVTTDLLWRWRSEAQRALVDVDVPRPMHLPVYAGVSYDWRDESWHLSGQPNQAADFRLRTHEVGMRVLVPLRLPQLSLAAAVAGRRRAFEPAPVSHPAADPVPSASAVDSQSELETARGVFWMRFSPVLQLSEREPQSGAGVESGLRGSLDLGRTRNPVSQHLSRLSISWENRFDWVSHAKRQRTLLLGLHTGRLSEPGPAEDHFVLGVGPDADFWLRAHPFLRHAKPGQTPLAGEFVLGNMTAAADIKAWKWLKLGVTAFFDLAWMPRLYPGQRTSSTALDAGIGIELGSPLVSSRRFTLAWGHDAKTGRDVFYLAGSFR